MIWRNEWFLGTNQLLGLHQNQSELNSVGRRGNFTSRAILAKGGNKLAGKTK